MGDFVKEFTRRAPSVHPIVFAAHAHIQLATIHPFVDGNGRYPAASRAEYLRTLEQAQITPHIEPFVRMTAEAVDWMQQRYLFAIIEKFAR